MTFPHAANEPSGDAIESAVAGRLRALENRIGELERELRLRDQFIAAVAHELRNPVSPVFLHLDRLSGAVRSAEGGFVAAAWLLPQLDRLSGRLHRFMDALERLLDVTRIDTGRLTLVLERVDLAEVVREAALGFARELSVSGSSLELDVRPVVGLWDRVRLEQVVSNLLSNAIRYGAGREITIRLGADGEQATLSVRDRGIGIDQAHHQRIFERFERVSESTARGGLGIGLWVVRQICAAMCGTIDVQSRLGEGAVFTVTLPLDPSRSHA